MADDDWAKQVEDQERGKLEEKVKDLTITVPNSKDDGGGSGGGGGDSRKVEENKSEVKVAPEVKKAPDVKPWNDEEGGWNDAETGKPEPAAAAPAAAADTSQQEENDVTALAVASVVRKALRDKLVNIKHEVEVLRKDPNSPLYSVKSFEELHLRPELLKGVYGMGFNSPSKIQETALPMLLADPPKNMIAQSQSGTGKTAAFVLAMLSRVDTTTDYPQALCLAPTYELALQIGEVAEKMGSQIPGLGIRYAVKGEKLSRRDKICEHIIIGTPGTTLDWALKFKFFDISKVRVFVLDEADVMIATQGHQDQSMRIKMRLNERICQMMLFSATYDEVVIKFAQGIIPDPSIIRLRREEESLDNIKQFYIECNSQDDKFEALANIYGTVSVGQAMIFCHTKRTAAWLAEKMSIEGHAVALLTGDLTVEQRVAVLNRFRDGKEKVLITTNVAARGIDVESVTVVVNFDIPVDVNGHADCDTYLHRIGRTGRFGKSGLALNMVDGKRALLLMRKIEDHFGRKIDKLRADDMEEIEKIAEQ
ncbi:ATP-dependent RNA helicase DDX19A-like [Glandiceps talaboti]